MKTFSHSKPLVYFASGLFALILGILVIIGAGLPQRAAYTGRLVPGHIPIAPEISAVAPDFSLETIDGSRLRLSDLRGMSVVINFWATWCEPCRAEMPILQTVFENNSDLRILGVNVGEPPERIRDWRAVFGLTYDMLLDEQQSVAALYALRGQPSTYVISPDGLITHIFYGPVSERTLQAALTFPQ